MSNTMGMYQVFYHVPVKDETNTKIIGKGHTQTINVLGLSRGEAEKYVSSRFGLETEQDRKSVV